MCQPKISPLKFRHVAQFAFRHEGRSQSWDADRGLWRQPGHLRSIGPNFAASRSNLADTGPKPVDFGPNVPRFATTSTNTGPESTKLGPNSTDWGRTRPTPLPNWAQHRPTSSEFGTAIDRILPEIGQTWAELGRTGPDFVAHRPDITPELVRKL